MGKVLKGESPLSVFEFDEKVVVSDRILLNPCVIINPPYDVLFELEDELGVNSDHIIIWFWPVNCPASKTQMPANDTSWDHPYIQIRHKKEIDRINQNDMVYIPIFLADRDMDFLEEDKIVADFNLDKHKKPDGSLVVICKGSVVSFEADYYPPEDEQEILDDLDLSQLPDPEMPLTYSFTLLH